MKDVTGFTLEEALGLLKEEGAGEIEVKLTTAPRNVGEEYNLQSRVVRQKLIERSVQKENAFDASIIELIVCNL